MGDSTGVKVAKSPITPLLISLGSFQLVMGYNGVIGITEVPYSVKPIIYQMKYSIPYEYNVNFMLITQGIAIIMYIVYRIFLKVNEKRMDRNESNLQ